MTPLLEVSHLAYDTPDGCSLFSGISFALSPGQLLLISGPNGSGKSTLLKLLQKDLKPKQGLVRCTVPQEKIGTLHQMQNIAFHLPLLLGDVVALLTRKSATEVINLHLLRVEDFRKSWNTASGGERQRTLLSCLLANSPDLLILDEPLNHLDSASQDLILLALDSYLSGTEGKGVLLVSHRVLPPQSTLRQRMSVLAMGKKENHSEM